MVARTKGFGNKAPLVVRPKASTLRRLTPGADAKLTTGRGYGQLGGAKLNSGGSGGYANPTRAAVVRPGSRLEGTKAHRGDYYKRGGQVVTPKVVRVNTATPRAGRSGLHY